MDDNRLVKIARNGKVNTWTVSERLARKLHRNVRGTLDKMQDTVPQEEEKEEEEEEEVSLVST